MDEYFLIGKKLDEDTGDTIEIEILVASEKPLGKIDEKVRKTWSSYDCLAIYKKIEGD